MGSLRSLTLRLDYRSSHGALVDEFYVPCLEQSSVYWRAAGFFTSRSLALAAAGLTAFIEAGGTMRMIASPRLEPEDFEALARGYAAREDLAARALLRAFEDAKADLIVRERLGYLAWLVSEERLDFRVVMRLDSAGMYHEKFGIFFDAEDDAVAFTGSANETWGGLTGNFEGIDVFPSWTGDRLRVQRKVDAFTQLWEGQTPGTVTLELAEAVRERLLDFRPSSRPSRPRASQPKPENEAADMPLHDEAEGTSIQLRGYQHEAIDAWLNAGGRGVLEMATGTGKTITALAAAQRALSERGRAMLVVVAPFIHLVDQWAGEMRRFGLYPVRCYGASATWGGRLADQVDLVRLGADRMVACVGTHQSLRSPAMREALGRVGPHTTTMLIADEVHHLGSAQSFKPLSTYSFSYRLGLSATPNRWLDPEGNERLHDYFGETVYEFGLSRAMSEGFLTPYEYKPVLVELDADEVASYTVLTGQIARALDAGETEIGPLLRRRAEVLNAARGKLEALRRLVPPNMTLSHALFYSTPSRLEATIQLLMTHTGLRVHRFTFREDRAERLRLLAAFAKGDLHGLVAIRCLDEGVDVPGTRTAFLLASSGNPREFVQRRGRILRVAPGKKRAMIYDLITVPGEGHGRDDAGWEAERGIVQREIQRLLEFADNSLSANEARKQLLPLQMRYELLDL